MALRLVRRQPPLSCNLVLCIEKVAFGSSCSDPAAAPGGKNSPANQATPCDNPPAAGAAATPPAALCSDPPAVEPAAAAPCPGDGAGSVPPLGSDKGSSGDHVPTTHDHHVPTHQPPDPPKRSALQRGGHHRNP